MAEIVILGAGLTGLSTAYHLEKVNFYDYKLFEKEVTPGGLCRSIYQDGFTFDYTGHLLHSNDDYFTKLLKHLVGLEHFNVIRRQSFIYSQDRYTRYPYQINLNGLPAGTIIECIEEFINRPHKKNPRTFYEWVITHFGKGFGKYFFFPYQEKIFSYPVKKLTASWTGRFVPPTSLHQLLQGALNSSPDEDIGYNAHFLYPLQGGIYFWIEKLYHHLKNNIFTNHEVIKIDTCNKVVYFENGAQEPYNQLITTIPLNTLLLSLHEKSNSNLKQATHYLCCNSVVNFNIGINRPNLSDKHWIYYPENHYPFYRIGFPHNFSSATVPSGCSSLYGEFSYLKNNSFHKNEKLSSSLYFVKELLSFTEKDIVTQKIITIPHAYVIYNTWRDKNLPTLLSSLQEINIYSIGRYGAWKYSSMQEAVLEGKKMSEEILRKKCQSVQQSSFSSSP